MELIEKFLDFLFPKFCVHCGKFGYYLCQKCYDQVEFIKIHHCPECKKPAPDGFTHPGCQHPLGIDGILSVAEYKGPIKSLITAIKYKPWTHKAFEEVELILRRYLISEEDYFPPDCVIIPIPLHPSKLRIRKFNQAKLVAEVLSELWGVKLGENWLLRVKKGKDQQGLPRKERLRNVQGLYEINQEKKEKIKDSKIILTDDVTTSGATLKECAKVLKRNGVSKVWAVTLARG